MEKTLQELQAEREALMEAKMAPERAIERKWQEANGKLDPAKKWEVCFRGVTDYDAGTWDEACDLWTVYDDEDIGGVTVLEITPATATDAAMAVDVTSQVEEYIAARIRRRFPYGMGDGPEDDELPPQTWASLFRKYRPHHDDI